MHNRKSHGVLEETQAVAEVALIVGFPIVLEVGIDLIVLDDQFEIELVLLKLLLPFSLRCRDSIVGRDEFIGIYSDF